VDGISKGELRDLVELLVSLKGPEKQEEKR
jgi:hypothetical protein